jgi:hypothetical protein
MNVTAAARALSSFGLMLALGCVSIASEVPPIVGTWRLLSAEDSLPDGSVVGWMGGRPHGLLVYTTSGHVSLQVMREPRSQLPAGIDSTTLITTAPYRTLTAEQMRDVYLGYYAYTGRYEVNVARDSVTHRIENSLRPPEVGRENSRAFRIEGERLILSSHLQVEGARRHRVLTWRRSRP